MMTAKPMRLFHPLGGIVLGPSLIVADLHLEKGTRVALRPCDGGLVPPYDTRETLRRLICLVREVAPTRVILLGDTFDDVGGWDRLDPEDRQTLTRLATDREVIWIRGNHDPWPAGRVPGLVQTEFRLAGHVFRHEARPDHDGPQIEVSGHFHPAAKVRVRGSFERRPCFIEARHRLILPALGAYTGGLNVLDPAFAPLKLGAFHVHLLGRRKVYRFSLESLAA